MNKPFAMLLAASVVALCTANTDLDDPLESQSSAMPLSAEDFSNEVIEDISHGNRGHQAWSRRRRVTLAKLRDEWKQHKITTNMKNYKKSCWKRCGRKTGQCPQFCGKNAVCCRFNHGNKSKNRKAGCDTAWYNRGCAFRHCCLPAKPKSSKKLVYKEWGRYDVCYNPAGGDIIEGWKSKAAQVKKGPLKGRICCNCADTKTLKTLIKIVRKDYQKWCKKAVVSCWGAGCAPGEAKGNSEQRMNILRCVQKKCGSTYLPARALVDSELKKCNYEDEPAPAAKKGWLGQMNLQSNHSGDGVSDEQLDQLHDAVAHEHMQGGAYQQVDLELVTSEVSEAGWNTC